MVSKTQQDKVKASIDGQVQGQAQCEASRLMAVEAAIDAYCKTQPQGMSSAPNGNATGLPFQPRADADHNDGGA